MSCSSLAYPSSTSGTREPSSSSLPISHRVSRSSHWLSRRFWASSLFWSCFIRWVTFWDFSRLSQNPGAALSDSSISSSWAALARFRAWDSSSRAGRRLFSFTLYSSNCSIVSRSLPFQSPSYYTRKRVVCKGKNDPRGGKLPVKNRPAGGRFQRSLCMGSVLEQKIRSSTSPRGSQRGFSRLSCFSGMLSPPSDQVNTCQYMPFPP